MGVQGFQEYIEKHCPSAVVSVLQKLARGSMVGCAWPRSPLSPLRLLVDAENCLHRLYGGFYTDWVSGGQWNHMLGYLAALSEACFKGNIELLVCFNGALEKGRLHEWVERQVNERQTAQQIISHVQNKGTPPPKVFLPPVCMVHCIRLALHRFRIGVSENSAWQCQLNTAALDPPLAHTSDYALFNIPCYFSGHALKLSRNGKSLTTSQYMMHKVAQQLNLNPSRYLIFAALLGNHILPDEDLAAFLWSILGPEHPLASLKVRAHQLVLPPCDVVIKAVADYVRNIRDITNLEAIAKDIFKYSQFLVQVHPVLLDPNSALPLPSHSQATFKPSTAQLRQSSKFTKRLGQEHSLALDCVERDPTEQNNLSNIPHEGKHTPLYERSSPINPGQGGSPNHTEAAVLNAYFTSSSSESEENSDTTANHVSDHKGRWEKNGHTPHSPTAEGDLGYQTTADLCVTSVSPWSQTGGPHSLHTQIPFLLSMPTRNHMDITIPPLPAVAPEVLRVAEHKHKKGLMYPYIYHTLTKGEIKLSVTVEDEANKDLLSAVQLFRPIRQHVYGVLFSLAEARKKAERLFLSLQAELVAKVEEMRQSILEGLYFTRPPHPPPYPPLQLPPPHRIPFFPTGSFYAPPLIMPPPGRGRGMPGLQAISSQGGKLEIAGTVVGHWAGARHSQGRGGYPVQVVSVGGSIRGHPRGVISTNVIRSFGRGARYHPRAFKSQGAYQSKPALKSVHTSGHDAGKDRKKPKPEERISSPPPCDASTPENGVEDKVSDQLNGDKEECRALFQLESAFSSDSKMCNSNPHLNTDSSFHRGVGLESAVLQREG
ncbi:LOW QUALITY PROTEIN: constitutive coactivator of PPAR-gamma-like protein 1 homolog [Acanthopagrus schlegelii]